MSLISCLSLTYSLQLCFSLMKKNHELQTANSELSEQQKKLHEKIASLQSRLYLLYWCSIECLILLRKL